LAAALHTRCSSDAGPAQLIPRAQQDNARWRCESWGGWSNHSPGERSAHPMRGNERTCDKCPDAHRAWLASAIADHLLIRPALRVGWPPRRCALGVQRMVAEVLPRRAGAQIWPW